MKLLYETEEKVLGTRENVKEFLKENFIFHGLLHISIILI